MDDFDIKQEAESSLIYTIDNNTQLEFLSRKTIIVIDKDRFLVCKQLMMESSPDEDFAAFLNIPLEKVRHFKHKMQIFEDSIRARRRAARINSQRRKRVKPVARKREVSAKERFKHARELISKNYSTNQISKILKISERSVTRFKKRIREEKRRLKKEGKIHVNPEEDDSNAFKYLSVNEKIKRAKELFQKNLKLSEISMKLRVSERTVRRWQIRLEKMKENGTDNNSKDDVVKVDSEDENLEEKSKHKRRRAHLDREKVQYARELIENGLSNKEMSMLLEMSVACVRKLKMKILNGTSEELIDDTVEHYKKINSSKENGSDPLNDMPQLLLPKISKKISCERRQKVNLSDRDMYIVRLLRDNHVRTMDIARMVGISERSVTRLLSKAKELTIIQYEPEVLEEVSKLLASKNEILDDVSPPESVSNVCEESKENVGLSLLAMHVKVKDIAKMLDVTEKTVHKWKSKMIKEERKNEKIELHANLIAKEEYIIEYLE